MEFKKKHVLQQWYPNQYYGSSLTFMNTLWFWEPPNIKK